MKTIISLSIYIVVCVTLAGLGVGAGWQMAQQKGSAGGGHGHEQAEDDGHADSSAPNLRGTVPVGRGCAGAAHTESDELVQRGGRE